MTDHHDFKSVIDAISAGAAIGTVAQLLPTFAAVLSIAWTAIRITEWVYSKLQR